MPSTTQATDGFTVDDTASGTTLEVQLTPAYPGNELLGPIPEHFSFEVDDNSAYHLGVDLSIEKTIALRDWLNEKLGGR